jgi:hypothetical protein
MPTAGGRRVGASHKAIAVFFTNGESTVDGLGVSEQAEGGEEEEE